MPQKPHPNILQNITFIHILLYSQKFSQHVNFTVKCETNDFRGSTLKCFVHFCYEYAEVSLPELLEEPHQPALNFPKGSLARRNLCTEASRTSGLPAKWHWLHYDEAQDAVFCFICALSWWYTYVLMFS